MAPDLAKKREKRLSLTFDFESVDFRPLLTHLLTLTTELIDQLLTLTIEFTSFHPW